MVILISEPFSGVRRQRARGDQTWSPRAVVEVQFLDFTYCDVAEAWLELALVPAELPAVKT